MYLLADYLSMCKPSPEIIYFFSIQAFEDECCKARSVVATLEQNIKALLKIYDSKKKVCAPLV